MGPSVHCCLIIAEGYDGVACQGNEIGEQMEVCDVPRQFQLRVGDVTCGVVAGHEARAQVGR